MLARSATCCSVSPRSVRSSRSRRRTRTSTGSPCCLPSWQKSLADRAPRVTLGRMETTWDCIVVGAGAAGLSAALVLGRARRRTLVVDAGGQSNRVATASAACSARTAGRRPTFYAAGRDELAAYPTVELRAGEVVGGEPRRRRLRARAGRRLARAGAPRAARHRDGLPPARRCRGSRSAGAARCSTARSATAGRSATAARRARPRRRGRRSARCCCAPGATTSRCSPTGPPSSTPTTPSGCAPPASRSTSAASPGCAARATTLAAVAFADGERAAVRRAARARHAAPALGARRAARRGRRRAGPARRRRARGRRDVRTPASPGVFAAGDVSAQMPSVANAIAAGSTAAAMVVHDLMAEAAGRAPAAAEAGAAPAAR